MNPKLLEFYERELSRLRRDGSELARAVAGAETLAELYEDRDPFVVQLIQAFAYAVARIELELDTERDRLPGAVLQTLYPASVRPVPARTVVQFGLPAGGDVPAEGREIPAHSPFATADAAEVLFRTTSDCVVPSVELGEPQLLPPADSDRTRHRLRFSIRSPRPQLRLDMLRLRLPRRADVSGLRRDDAATYGLRLFLGGADSPVSLRLYQALTRAPVGLNLISPAGAVAARLEGCIRLVGFDTADAVLPIDPRQSEALRLLSEYAVFRDKFLFVDVVGLAPERFKGMDQHATLELLLDPGSAALLEGFGLAQSIRLGCVPVVNVERRELPGRPLHRARGEFLLEVDPHEGGRGREVLSIERVHASYQGQTEVEYLEMFAPVPPGMFSPIWSERKWGPRRQGGYWHARRVPDEGGTADWEAWADAPPGGGDGAPRSNGAAAGAAARGQDVRLSLVEFDPARALEPGRTLRVGALCFLRDVAGMVKKQLALRGDAGEARSVTRVLGPTWPETGGDMTLTLVQLLSCGAGLLRGGRDSAAALADLLALHGRMYPAAAGPSHLLHEAIVRGVETRVSAAGVPGGVARGLDVDLRVDSRGTSPHDVYLLARVLDYALSAFCSAGGFTRLRVIADDGLNQEVLAECPPRLGKVALI